MNILFITLFSLEINTSVTISNYGLINGLEALGHKITIVMPEINNTLSYYDNVYDLSNVSIKRIKNQNIGSKMADVSSQAKGTKKKIIDILRNLYNKYQLFDRSKLLIKEAKNMDLYSEYYDIIISTSDPKTSHLFAKKLIDNGLKYGKWIQHWGDPLSGDISKTSAYPEIYIKWIEKKILKNADKIVYVSPFTLNVQKNNYKNIASKMKFVPLPCSTLYKKNSYRQKQKYNNNLVVTYLGDYNSKIRNILPLYNACKNSKNIELIIAGNSNLKLEETSNIHIYPRVSQYKANEIENESDVLICIGNLKGTQIPGKIYYASSNGKPILVAIDGDESTKLIEYIASFDRFYYCENKESSIKSKLEEIYNNVGKIYDTPQCLLPIYIAQNIISD